LRDEAFLTHPGRGRGRVGGREGGRGCVPWLDRSHVLVALQERGSRTVGGKEGGREGGREGLKSVSLCRGRPLPVHTYYIYDSYYHYYSSSSLPAFSFSSSMWASASSHPSGWEPTSSPAWRCTDQEGREGGRGGGRLLRDE
jgi:hypothetical protein